jgi:cytochrome b561
MSMTASKARYTRTAQALHWLTAVLIFATLPIGMIMTDLDPGSAQNRLYETHKGIGVALAVIILVRLAWRLLHRPPPLAAVIPLWEARLAQTVHALLYVSLLVMVASGYTLTVAGGFPIAVLDQFGVPPLLAEDKPFGEAAETVHKVTKYVLLALLTLHIAGAVRHMLKGDGVIRRMLPLPR